MAGVLSLPQGLRYRFKYRHRWIAHGLPVDQLKNRDAVVFLRLFRTGVLVPVRRVRIVDTVTYGGIHCVEFIVGSYCGELDDTLEGLASASLRAAGVVNHPNEELEPLVFPLAGYLHTPVGEPPDAVSDWYRIVDKIGDEPCYVAFGFFNLVRIATFGGTKVSMVDAPGGGRALGLRSSVSYVIDVMQYTPSLVEVSESVDDPYDVVLRAEPGVLTLVRHTQRVVGKYDLLRFFFKTPQVYRETATFCEIAQASGPRGEWLLYPSVFLPAVIAPPRWNRLSIVVRIVAFIASFGAYLRAATVAPWLGISVDAVRWFAIAVLVFATRNWVEALKETVKKVQDSPWQ